MGSGTRDYYLNDSVYGNQMAAYEKYMNDMIQILLIDLNMKFNDSMRKQIAEVLEFERQFALITTPDDQRRNHSLMYNRWTLNDLQKAMPFVSIYWKLETLEINIWYVMQERIWFCTKVETLTKFII